jgi:hypothetical protein
MIGTCPAGLTEIASVPLPTAEPSVTARETERLTLAPPASTKMTVPTG